MKLIGRNIRRNRRRAKITIASVFFAVFFCILLNSIVNGLWEKMRDDVLRTQTGHIRINLNGYWDDKIIDNFMKMDYSVIARLETLDNVENVSPRVEIIAMASYETQSKGVAIVGVSPEREKEKSNLPIRLAKGQYLTETDDGILIGEGLANFLHVDVGDTVVFIGQGYQGANAAGLFPVRGLLRLSVIEMDNGLVYMTLSAAQTFIDMPDGYSGVLISIKKESLLNNTIDAVKGLLSVPGIRFSENTENYQLSAEIYEVLSWHVTMKELMQTAKSHKGMVMMIMMILYLIVGFGILGTVIMMTNERKREFAMLISLGMSRKRLKIVTFLELLVLTLTGVILATAVTIPLTLYFSYNPIQITGDLAQAYAGIGMDAVMGTVFDPNIFITQAITVLLFAGITFIYPIRKIGKLKITNNR